MKNLFDSHTHINDPYFSKGNNRRELIREIEKSDIAYAMDIGCDLETSMMAVNHAKEYPWCYAVVGYHPHEAKDMGDMELMMIKSLAKKDKVQAIGEIGLDFHYNHSDQDVQRECFRKQIRLANELKMPIVIHSREADQECMDILREEGAFSDERKSWFPLRPDGTKDARVLLHCFSGSREIGEQYVRQGATLSIAGPVTYKNNRKTPAVVEAIPLMHLLIETDAPWLTPEPMRGKKNKSPLVEFVARKIAEIKGISYEEVAEQTCENAKRFFDIK